MRLRLIIGLVAIAATSLSAQRPFDSARGEAASVAQDRPAASFRAGIDLFTVEASVLDGSGKPIADLSPADFTVTVGGKPRNVRTARYRTSDGIDSIAPVDDAPQTAPVTNGGEDGRIVVFVVDRDSIAPGSERAILESASTLLDGLRPADASGVLELPGSTTELTRDRARVRASLMRITGSRPTTTMRYDYNLSWDEALAYERGDDTTIRRVVERECQDFKVPDGMRNQCPPDLKSLSIEMLGVGRARTQTVLSNLSTLARQLEPLRGAKQIVLLTSGFPFGQDLLPLYNQFEKQAAAAQIVFYAVHLEQAMTDVTARTTTTSAFGGSEFASGVGNLASMTGGAMFMASGNAAGIFQRVANEIHNFYELAIETVPADLAAGTLDVDVNVNRPGASVRNRRRVLAPSKSLPAGTDRLSEMLRQPIDVSEVPVALSVYTMRGDDASTLRTLVALDAGAAGSAGPSEWGFAVFNEGNVVATGRQKLDKTSDPWTAAMSAKLVPGRYRVRAAIIDGANRTGVVERALEVGLRGNQQVQFSDLLVGIADANGRLQPSSRVTRGAQMSALIEVIAADPAVLEKVRTMIEIVPGGTATPLKRFMMAARIGAIGSILSNSVEIATADLNVGRYTAIATPMIGEQPLGKVSRVFEITSRP